MKKIVAMLSAGFFLLGTLAGCSKGFDKNSNITVITREDGSGTRGAFNELFKVDNTVSTADINNSTGIVLTSVSQNKNAIGYISLGSLNDTVKALRIDNVVPSAENIKNGTYKISRPFNIATKDNVSDAAKDFISYILSLDGQAVITGNGYIAVSTTSYASKKPSGKVVVAGSSSVTPVMEKLKEAYNKVNPNLTIEIQQSDSTTGMNNAKDGVCDIGMASRELKDSEKQAGLKSTVIAMDGIVMIVNKENTVDNLTKDQVKSIYAGTSTKWNEFAK